VPCQFRPRLLQWGFTADLDAILSIEGEAGPNYYQAAILR